MPKFLILVIVIALHLCGAGLAEPANLEGTWVLKESGDTVTRYLHFRAGGPSWKAVANSKLLITLDLEPTEKENEWLGVLKDWEEQHVRATLIDPDSLELAQVDGSRRWTMTRRKTE